MRSITEINKFIRFWRNRFNRLIFVYIVTFSVIPLVFRNLIPHDMIENLYWGKELQLGYAKHPPLFSWISYFFYKIFFSCPESLYILTQLNLLLGFYFIFKISMLIFEDEMKSYAAILIFMASVCAVFGNEKFNATTILISLFPAMFFFFVRLLKFNKKKDAFALGVASALAFIGKYFALLYIGCLGLFLLFHKKCWRLFKTQTPYIVVATFLVCISWHIYWIYNSHFVTIEYALSKSTRAPKDFFSAFNFLLMQLLFFSTSFWAFTHSYCGKMNVLPSGYARYSLEEKFILFITIIPNTLLFLISLISGMRIGSFWGINMFMTLGIYLLIINKNEINPKRLFDFVKYISIIFALILSIKLGGARYFLREYDPTNAINIRGIASHIDENWRKQFGNEKMTILKADKSTAALHIYLRDSPSLYDCKRYDLFHIYDTYPKNADVVVTLLCAKNDDKIKFFKNLYKKHILFENIINIINGYIVYYAFINVTEKSGKCKKK